MSIITEALYFGDSLSFSLLPPVQLQDNDVHVDEGHCQHAHESIFGIHVLSESLQIPFTLDGGIAGFDTRPPTQDEFNDTALHIELTSDVGWVPHTFADSLAEEEDPIIDDVDEKKDYQFVSMALEGLGFQNSKTKDQQLHANPIGDSVPF